MKCFFAFISIGTEQQLKWLLGFYSIESNANSPEIEYYIQKQGK